MYILHVFKTLLSNSFLENDSRSFMETFLYSLSLSPSLLKSFYFNAENNTKKIILKTCWMFFIVVTSIWIANKKKLWREGKLVYIIQFLYHSIVNSCRWNYNWCMKFTYQSAMQKITFESLFLYCFTKIVFLFLFRLLCWRKKKLKKWRSKWDRKMKIEYSLKFLKST